MARLGEGLDNVAYEVNGELIVRRSKEADPASRNESARREADLLSAVARLSPLPIPEPVFADVEAGALAYIKLPGVPLLGHPVAEPTRLAPHLGRFLSRLHAAPVQKMEKLVERDTHPLTEWQEEAERDYREIGAHIPAPNRRLVEVFLASALPPEPYAATFCHNDLGAEHLLVDIEASAVTGVIDWTDASIADPACDLALIYRDLGPGIFDLTLSHYEGHWDDATRERAAFYARCALIEDIALGLRTPGAHRYAQIGLAHLARTFA